MGRISAINSIKVKHSYQVSHTMEDDDLLVLHVTPWNRGKGLNKEKTGLFFWERFSPKLYPINMWQCLWRQRFGTWKGWDNCLTASTRDGIVGRVLVSVSPVYNFGFLTCLPTEPRFFQQQYGLKERHASVHGKQRQNTLQHVFSA